MQSTECSEGILRALFRSFWRSYLFAFSSQGSSGSAWNPLLLWHFSEYDFSREKITAQIRAYGSYARMKHALRPLFLLYAFALRASCAKRTGQVGFLLAAGSADRNRSEQIRRGSEVDPGRRGGSGSSRERKRRTKDHLEKNSGKRNMNASNRLIEFKRDSGEYKNT